MTADHNPNATDPAMMSAVELVERFADGSLSPVEATKAAFDRVHKHQDTVNAFILLLEDDAMDAARASEARWKRGEPIGLVDGVPATIKDIILLKGHPTLRGSKTIDPNQAWDEDAPCVARLKEHGAVILGKTTTPEFGWKPTTDSPLTGITRNPWNTSRTPGGSSGGAAAACALGMGALHIGTDGGGSIRIPAAFTGIFGFKQTFGLVPAYPLSPMGSVSHVGPMTRTVADTALMLNVITQPDARDWYSITDGDYDFAETLDAGIEGLRVGYSRDLGGAKVSPDIAASIDRAVAVLGELGATVEEVEAPFPPSAQCFITHWYAAAAQIYRTMSAEQRDLLDPGLRDVMEVGSTFPLNTYYDAMRERERMGLAMSLMHEKYDLLVTPMMPVTALEIGDLLPEPWMSSWMDWTPFSYPFNLTQQPAASIPCGFGTDGLPIGLQIVGPKFGDTLVLAAARAYEEAHPFEMPTAPNVTHITD